MRIVLISDQESSGGAAIAATRLAAAFRDAGHEVARIVADSDGGEDAGHIVQAETLPLPIRAARYATPASFTQAWVRHQAGEGLARQLKAFSPQAINLHNVHGAARVGWSPDIATICMRHAPTLWTLHDAWSFTGRCAYTYDCRKFITGCDVTCPTPHEYPALRPTRIAGAWLRRKEMYETNPILSAVAPSQWLADEARCGMWRDHRIEVIPNGLSLDMYHPHSRDWARQELDLVTSQSVVLTVAERLGERRKGTDILIEALENVSLPLTLVTMGKGTIRIRNPTITVRNLGYVASEHQKSLVYSAADLLIHPALVDNLPNVVMEAMSCGTPTLAFSVGGIPEMVHPGQSGWLALDVSPHALATELTTAIDDIRRGQDYRHSCRSIAEHDYSVALQADRYLQAFSSLANLPTDVSV